MLEQISVPTFTPNAVRLKERIQHLTPLLSEIHPPSKNIASAKGAMPSPMRSSQKPLQ